jgi:pyruvate kinase
VERDVIECEIQNEGHIYENSQITFSGENVDGQSDDASLKEDEEAEENPFRRDIAFSVANDVDYIIHSVYEGRQEIIDMKRIISEETEKHIKSLPPTTTNIP